MASVQKHRQFLMHGTEVSVGPRGDGAVTVRITDNTTEHVPPQQHQQANEQRAGATVGGSPLGNSGTTEVDPTSHKYSFSSCSSGDSGVRRSFMTTLRSHSKVPPLFERSAAQCWDPKFDSSILEEACRERCFPQTQRRFRYVLIYLAACSVLWGVYFGVHSERCHPVAFLAPTASFLLLLLLLFLFTFTQPYTRFYNQASLLLITATFAITLAPQIQTAGFSDPEGSGGGGNQTPFGPPPSPAGGLLPPGSMHDPVGTFSLCMEVLLLLYSVLHIRLYASVLLGLLFSVLYETLGWLPLLQRSYDGGEGGRGSGSGGWEQETLPWLGPGKALLHLCAHVIGIHLFIMSEVRSRSTFLKVGQAIMHGKDLEVEKALKERMIHSVMPRRVADELMRQGDDEDGGAGKRYSAGACSAAGISAAGGGGGGGGGGGPSSTGAVSPKNHTHHHRKRKKTSLPRGKIVFRPFNMTRMEPVSILFADIVGFTKMSANKSAHALVGLLNDLFGRFDRLCELTCCAKISTLGDCYYCVAGCPEPRPDHAYCCVEMGLGMIQAIEQFCQETRETVDMRVGVHTGTVLCGILGMKRFKFDVWSNDVNLANLMEQLGVAGKVHLSEATAGFLDERYHREDGRVEERAGRSQLEQLKGLKTYLISRRKSEHAPCDCSQLILGGWGDTVGDSAPLPPAPRPHTPDLIPGGADAEPLLPSRPPDRIKCGPCAVGGCPGAEHTEEGAVLNGCQEELKTNCAKFVPGHSPRVVNGLLSPPLEDPVRASQSSLYEMLQEKEKKNSTGTGTGTSPAGAGAGAAGARAGAAGAGMDHSALISLRSKNFRERSDAHFVDVIKEDSLMKDYFFKPPINKISLNFLERPLETAYRVSYQEEVENKAPVQTFASPTFSSLLDVLLSCSVFLALTLACFLPAMVAAATPPPAAMALAAVAGLLELVSLVLSIKMTFYLADVRPCTQTLLQGVSGWLPRHLVGAVLVSLPAISVFSHLASGPPSLQVTKFLCCATIIAIIQYCNFCQLSFWMRSVLATAAGAALLLLLSSPLYRPGSSNDTSPAVGNLSSETWPATPAGWSEPVTPVDLLLQEAVLAFFLLLLLVWFLNREFEVSYRLHYHGNVEADKHRSKIRTMRDQANWLLGNIIPIHVAEQLKVNQSYSKNHDDVGVIFASIVNFSEFYEESYEGGKECYRVLNELIGDFDELLHKPAFSNVEKIKTIGATYMAASGLNVQRCSDCEDDGCGGGGGGGGEGHPLGHLRALFDFALEMTGVLDDFNKNMLGFGFKLRIGFNHGPLTAGVIGTTKLLYDIWGDTVNIASRMDSTGVECRVQVSEESHTALSAMGLEFDYRGTVNVKGKGQMRTFLYPPSIETGLSGSQPPLAVSQGGGEAATSTVTEVANEASESAAKALAPPISSSSSSSRHAPPPPGQGLDLGTDEPAGVKAEGYRDAPRPSGPTDPQPQPQSPTLDPPPDSRVTQATSLPLRLEREEEEEVDELTKLNEEFCERL
ncbi:LOW QUALITY PROTEIN: adenylate cyclase type 9 [Osmerus mordax]|uniref:LOW QUALITY PROTEIN: adenylate cyclase type 9 n=1 Tax=Osmerus mordax TaxID=8014 RepID=UPI00350EBAEA